MTVRICAALAAALLVTALAVSADPPADPKTDLKKEKEKFKGTWVVKSFEEDGKPIDALKGMTFAFDGDKFTSRPADQPASAGTYKLDPSKELRHLDLVVNRGGGVKTTTRAVYVFEGDELRIYAAQTNVTVDARGRVTEKIGERPKKTDGKTGATITLTREKK